MLSATGTLELAPGRGHRIFTSLPGTSTSNRSKPEVGLFVHRAPGVTTSARTATQTLLKARLPEIPVIDAEGRIAGFLGESEIAQAYVEASAARG